MKQKDYIVTYDEENLPLTIFEKKDAHFKTFGEEYWVYVDIPCGEYWRINHVIDVILQIEHGINETDNHELAENLVKKMFPNCDIKKSVYC